MKSGWNRSELEKPLVRLGIRSQQASGFGYHCAELLEICDMLPLEIEAFQHGAERAASDARTLVLASCILMGQFQHIRYHMVRAERFIRKVQDAAASMAPFSKGKPTKGDPVGKVIKDAFWKNDLRALKLCGMDSRFKRLVEKKLRKTKRNAAKGPAREVAKLAKRKPAKRGKRSH